LQFDEDGQSGHTPFSDKTIAAEATLALVAGSDTTGTAMANAMFNLLCSPNSMNNLRRELDNAAAESSGLKDGASAAYDVEIDEKDLHQLPYLNAVVNETLQLQPALPNGAQRLPPPEGGSVIVAGHVVPVGTTCQVPTWSGQ
jgi:cytochrome P450